MRSIVLLALASLAVLSATVAHAQPSVLIAASNPAQIRELEVAKVTAGDAPLWLSVQLVGRTKLAIMTSGASVEPAPAADAWLRALDFSTRVRVTPPPGPLATCMSPNGELADSGAPELSALAPSAVSSPSSELELRRSLAAAGLAVDLERLDEFCAGASGAFRFALYDSVESGGSTAAVRLRDSGPALEVPGVIVAGRDAVPLTLLTLAPTAVLPLGASVSDPSEFPLSYSGATASTDYAQARGAWLAEDPTRWLLEARASSALFGWTVISGAGVIEPALSRYFEAAVGSDSGRACFAAAQAARAHATREPGAYGCNRADDLERGLSALDFADIRLTRLFGSIGAAGVELGASNEAERDSHVVATDFDAQDCSLAVATSPGAERSAAPGLLTSPDGNASRASSDSSDGSTTLSDGESCGLNVLSDSCTGDSSGSSDSSSSDSCSGDGTSDSSSSDSCTGDGTSDSSSSDSCSGDSTNDSSSNDSCSGDSTSGNSDDSSGCGKSNYDGDTCSGSSASSASSESKASAALGPGQSGLGARRPHRVHLSLLTLLLASLALPLRRKRLWCLLTNP